MLSIVTWAVSSVGHVVVGDYDVTDGVTDHVDIVINSELVSDVLVTSLMTLV